MQSNTLNLIRENYKFFKKKTDDLKCPCVSNIIISEEKFIDNVKNIDLIYNGFWDNLNDKKLYDITIFFNEYTSVDKSITNEIVYLTDIVGVTHPNYSLIPWWMALASLKRLNTNFPKSEKEKKELFKKMKNNTFKEKIKLIKKNNQYFIYEGHNRIIICKCLGLEYLKCDIIEYF